MTANSLAVINFDGIQLLLPQQAVGSVEMSSSIVFGDEPGESIGQIRTSAGDCPVYAFSSDFSFLAECPADYRYCVAVNCQGQPGFAIVCEEVSSISIESGDTLKPLQSCMRSPHSPVESVMLRDNRLLLVSDAESLRQFLSPRAAA